MTGDRLYEATAARDGLLDTQVSSSFQTELQNIREGLSQGFSERTQHAKDNLLVTGVEVAGSFGVGAALMAAAKAGGRWGVAADVAGKVMLLGMGADVLRRGANVYDAYSVAPGNTVQDQLTRREAIAQNLGTAMFDYPVMMASGFAGAGAVHFGPKLSTSLRTSLEGLRTPMMPSMVEQPAFATVRATRMDLNSTGRLGAKELPAAKGSDPLAVFRERLDAPHRIARGMDELSALMEAKKVAGHPEVRPLYEQMSSTLREADTLKPLIARDEVALAAFDKQINGIKGLKSEIQTARQAESVVEGLRADIERLPSLTSRQSELNGQIGQAKKIQEGKAQAPADQPVPDIAQLREELGGVRQDIASIRDRQPQLSAFEQRHSEAQAALETRRKAIEAGTDPEIMALEAQMAPIRQTLEGNRSQMATLVAKLTELDAQYVAKSAEVKPLIAQSDSNAIFDLPKYERPQINVEPGPKPVKKVEASSTVAANPAAKVVENGSTAKPVKVDLAARTAEPIVKAQADAGAKPVAKADNGARPAERVERTTTSANQGQGDRRNTSNDRNARVEKVEAPRVTRKDVANAYMDAEVAVNDFLRTTKRHTTALKKVNDYIDSASKLMATDRQLAQAEVRTVLSNVETLLGKLENWERAPGWIRGAEKANVMKAQGISAETMAKFDKWYESQNQIFYERAASGSPEMKLAMIQEHLQRRVSVESVKNFLRTSGDVEKGTSPIVAEGFRMMAEGKLPDGRAIPKGSDLIVFEQRKVPGGQQGPQEAIIPFAKEGANIQRFDDAKIAAGTKKLEVLKNEGPEGLPAKDLYGLWLDHDPSRLIHAKNQVGFAILRPGGAHGKNVFHLQFKDGVEPALLPKGLRADAMDGTQMGTNTGVLYQMLRNMLNKPKS
ncbi:MAG: hypothetical protein K2X77_12770 [Candidatus Obscuribacterales bacterium]|jgi:hypothetical protein|nr:hypothetical protein [Candidatus Obscuribacterales bacterium]